MMSRTLDLNHNVQELCTEYPELTGIMADLGFKDITKPLALATVGKIMTIPGGAAMKNIPMKDVVNVLRAHDFEVAWSEDGDTVQGQKREKQRQTVPDALSRKDMLKSYVYRLTQGEDLEEVRKDFVINFSDVSAIEIAQAEQELIRTGTPVSEVQNLCDVHSALFHGATQAEKIARAEEAVQASYQAQQEQKQVAEAKEKKSGARLIKKTVHPDRLSGLFAPAGFEQNVMTQMKEMTQEEGHPLWILHQENLRIEAQLTQIEKAAERRDNEALKALLQQIKAVAGHYGKKDELFFPLLKRKYDISGPSDVMWGVDGEIREELRNVSENPLQMQDRLTAVLKRMREMIYKEENILFPLGAQYFTDAEWYSIWRDMPEFGYFGIEMAQVPVWRKAEALKMQAEQEAGKKGGAGEKNAEVQEQSGRAAVSFPTGQMSAEQLRAVLNTMSYELTFVDDQNITRYFNEGEKLFPRPLSALGTEVFDCHPPKAKPVVKQLIEDLREGRRDSMDVWMPKNGEPTLVRYMAVRDENGKYMGVLEVVQKMGAVAAHLDTQKS